MGVLRSIQGVAVWVILFCVSVSGQTVTLNFNAIPRGLEPTEFTISLGGFGNGMVGGERLWIHLPAFGGGYNNLLDSLTVRNTAGNVVTLSEAEWDSHREILRIMPTAAGDAVTINVAMGADDGGLGPLPPRGGIDGSWTNFAWVRRYTAACSGVNPVDCTGQTPASQAVFTSVQRFATGFGKLPTKMIGATGAVMLPTFTMAKAEGSTNSQGLSNCITVTFVSSVTMQALTNNGIFLTISGLVSNNLADQDDLPIYPDRANCRAATNQIADSVFRQSERKYRGTDGTLILRYETGQQLIAHKENVITFALNNPTTVQNSLPIFIAASGPACLQDFRCPDDDTVLTTVTRTPIESSNILESRNPFFTTKKLFQQTSDPGIDSVIFVTLSPSEDIAGSSTITVTGLCGSAFNAPNLPLITTAGGAPEVRGSSLGNPVDALADGLNGNLHAWDAATRVLKLSVSASGMTAGRLYAFGFRWRLLDTANSACNAMINSGAKFVSEPMENVGSTMGMILNPQFTTLRVGQATTRPGVTNYICVTLQSNANFATENDDEGSFQQGIITLSGLTGTNAATNPSATVFRCPNGVNANGQLTVDGTTWNANDAATRALWTNLPNTGGARMFKVPNQDAANNEGTFSWDATNARATLTVDTAFSLQSGTQYVFALNLENGGIEQGCQTVTLSATSGSWNQAAVPLVASPVTRALQDATETGDACPLKIYGRKFLTNAMAQITPMAEEDNTFTVTLKPNVDLTSDATGVTSTITITGLTNTLTSLTTLTTMPVPGTFYPRFSEVNFNPVTGVLQALLSTGACTNPPTMGLDASNNRIANTCMKAGFNYGFSIRLKNPLLAQGAPDVRIGAVYGMGSMPLTSVTPPSDPMKQVLRIIPATNIMKTYKIGQTNTIPGQKNAICVTLATWVGLSQQDGGVGNEFTTVTITGLGSDWKTSTQDQNIWHPETGGDLGDLPLTSEAIANPFAPQVHPRNRAPASMIGTETWSTATGRSNSQVHYSEADGTVTFVMNNLVRETEYPFCFLMTNPDSTSACKTIGLTVSSPNRDTSMYTMEQTQGNACVGFVGDKSFPLTTLRSATNVANAEPTMILEFRPNFGLTGGEVIELSGMSAYVPVGGDASEDRDVPIRVSRNGLYDGGVAGTFQPTARWIVSTGALRVTIQAASQITVPDPQKFCTTLPVPTDVNTWRLATSSGGCAVTSTSFNYEIMFDLQNKPAAQAAPAISMAAAPGISQLPTPEFPRTAVNTGMASGSRRWLNLPSHRRNDPQDLTITMVTRTHLYGGEAIVIDLPRYTGAVSGELFGVTSTGSDAFATFASAGDVAGSDAAMGRAFFTEGYSNLGLTSGARSGMTGPGLDGFLVLAESDPAREMHKPWFADPRPVYMGPMDRSKYARAGAGVYANISDIAETLGFSIPSTDPKLRVFLGSNNLAGMSVVCGMEERVVLAHEVTTSGQTSTVHLFIERGMTGSVAMCSLNYKQHVGMYTGMKGMVGNHEVVFKQGAGPLYFVSDESGAAPAYSALQGQAYTVYSRLELVAKHGADVPEGTTITITVPGIIFPEDASAAITPDTTVTIADKTTMSMALITPLAGATTLSAGMASGSYNVELTEWRPYVGLAAYSADFMNSLSGLYMTFFGAMSMDGMGTTTNAREVELDPRYYSAGNRSSWNSVKLASGSTLSSSLIAEKYAGSKLIMGMSNSAIRKVQLRVAVEMSALQSGVQTVSFLGPADGVFSPGTRNGSAPLGSYFRNDRVTIEPLGVLGKGFADGAFYSAGGADDTARAVDLIAPSSNVYSLGAVGNMIGGDSVQAVPFRTSGSTYQPVVGARDRSFIYQAPFPITAVTDYSASDNTEPSLTYDPGMSHPPQVFGASIRAMVMLMQPEALATGANGGGTPGGGNTGGGGGGMTPPTNPCAGVAIPTIVITATSDLAALRAQYPCGVTLQSCAGLDATTDGGTGCWQTRPPTVGTLTSIREIAVDDAATLTSITATGLNRGDIVSKIVRITGTENLRFLLRFVFSLIGTTVTRRTSDDVDPAVRRRQLLQSCPDGKEYRMVKLGEPVANSCSVCEATCASPAECSVGPGDWTTMLVDTTVCNPASTNNNDDDDDDDLTGTIIGSVVGGVLGLLTLIACCYLLSQKSARKPKLAPVYLPEEYPVLPIEYHPNQAQLEAGPPPLYIQNDVQPTIYSSQPGGQYETYSGTAAQLSRSSAPYQGSSYPLPPGTSYPMAASSVPMPASAVPMMARGSAVPGPYQGGGAPMYGM